MKTGMTISAVGHLAVLTWAMVSFSVAPFQVAPADSLPVDIISMKDFSQLTKGVENAPEKNTQKPLVEKVAKRRLIDNTTAEVSDKPEIRPTSEPTPPSPLKPPEKKSEPKPAKSAPPKPAEKKAAPPKPKPAPKDAIAEALKKDEAKRKQKAEQTASIPTPKRRPPRPRPKRQPKFDASKVAALLDKRKPRRRAAAGETLSDTASLGLPSGAAPTLSQTEIDALRAQIQQCWNPPAGVVEAEQLIVVVRILLNQDGSLSGEPILLNRGGHQLFQIAAESAKRAIRRCQPYRLPIEKYQVWKDVEVTFDPRDMFRG